MPTSLSGRRRWERIRPLRSVGRSRGSDVARARRPELRLGLAPEIAEPELVALRLGTRVTPRPAAWQAAHAPPFVHAVLPVLSPCEVALVLAVRRLASLDEASGGVPSSRFSPFLFDVDVGAETPNQRFAHEKEQLFFLNLVYIRVQLVSQD